MQHTMLSGFASFKTRLITGALVLAVAASALMPFSAHAESKGGSGGNTGGCELVDENGTVVGHVPEGTQIGVAHCGADGEWHWGFNVRGRAVIQGTITQPQVAQAQR